MAHFHSRFAVVTSLMMLFVIACRGDSSASPSCPSDKEVLTAVFQLGSLPLTLHSSCKNIGTDLADSTIAQYLSGFWSTHTDTSGKNYIAVSCKPAPDQPPKGYHWRVELTLHRNNPSDNEVWGWGVRFTMRDSDRSYVPGSIECTGGG